MPGDTVYLKEANLEATVLKIDTVNGEIESEVSYLGPERLREEKNVSCLDWA